MGYAVGSITSLSQVARAANISGRRVIDLGSQDVTIFDELDLCSLESDIRQWGGNAQPIRDAGNGNFPFVVTARDVFASAGFDYLCCDVDRRPGTIYVDFNDQSFDRTLYGQFDVVMNAGTTEHLSNPVPAFFLMHHLCRKGGILYNEVPLSGWMNHGLVNLTPKFWHMLRWINGYDVLSARIIPVGSTSVTDGNFGGAHLDFIGNLADAGSTSSSIQIIFRKTGDRGFIPPFDAVIPARDGGEALSLLVWNSLKSFVISGAITEEEAAQAIDDFMEYQSLVFRVGRRGLQITADAVDRLRRRVAPRTGTSRIKQHIARWLK